MLPLCLHSADAAAGPTPAVGPVATLLPCARPRSLPAQPANAAAGPTLLPEPHAAPPQVPGHVQKFAGQHWRPEQLRSRFMNWLHEYKIQVRGMCGFD